MMMVDVGDVGTSLGELC